MVFDIAQFRANFQEFGDTVVYPTSMITFWAGLAEKLIRPCVWGNVWSEAVSLYVAHQITIEAQDAKAASIGGVPGVSGGIANSKTVGGASVGYDTVSTSEKNAGFYNLTNYGKSFYRMMRIFGAGCRQL